MSRSVKIVFIKQSKDAKEGTIYIRTITNRKAQKKSLGIKLDEDSFEKFFSKEKQRFRKDSRFKQWEVYNEVITESLKEASFYEDSLRQIPNQRKSVLSFWRNKIDIITNHGSKSKHEVVLSKLRKFLNARGKQDLLFSEITPTLVHDVHYYFKTARDPRILSENAATHYLKLFKSLIHKAVKEDYYHFSKNPFNSLELKSKAVKKPILGIDEVTKLLNAKLPDPKLNMAKNMFLFQIFSNGMRVSDLLLTRMQNFKNGRLDYIMFKTSAPISIPVNLNMALVISELSSMMPQYSEFLKSERIVFRDEEQIREIGLTKLKKLIASLKTPTYTYNPLVNKYLAEMNEELEGNLGHYIDYKGHKTHKNDERLKEFIELEEKLQKKIDDSYLLAMNSALKDLSTSYPKQFLFPVLNAETFGEFAKNRITGEQYKMFKHATIVYNRRLKKVQEECEIETNLSSHISRHTFTNLLLQMDGVNLYDVSLSLGHANIKVTEHYLRTGFNAEKLDSLNIGLAGKYRKG